ncbi:MAG TPA: ABC transporter substrate-binding protein [Candidatus Eisenbacteria bacterium]|nr:ABC transporter substrate-binding protein [Candidatus Eisenbacteria bacterium]
MIVLFLSFGQVRPVSAESQLRFVAWKPQPAWMWTQIIAEFERQNPGVKVVTEMGPQSSTDLHDLVGQKLRNRDPNLDVFLMDVIWPAEFASAGWALPLDRWFTPAEQKKFLAPPVLANTYRGRIYGVPLFVDAGMLYYRKDLLEKYGFAAPRLWPELVQQAQTILERENDPHLTGFSAQFKQYEGLVCNMMEYVLGNGGALWEESTLQGALDRPRAKDAVRFVRDRIIGAIAHRGVLAYQESESLALFAQGRAVFHRNWPYAWSVSNDPAVSKVAGRVGVAPLPAFAGHRSVSTLGGWQAAISRFSRQPELAWKFASFLTSERIQKRLALSMGRAPTRKELYNDAEVVSNNPQFKFQLEIFMRAVPRPRTPVYIPLSNIMQRYFSSAIAVSDSNIDQLAALAARDMNRVLDLLRTAAAP